MSKEREHFKLGATVLVMLALGVAMTVFIGRGSIGARHELAVDFPADAPVPLMKVGSAVLYGGREVGRIADVQAQQVRRDDRDVPVTRVSIRTTTDLDLRSDCRVVAVGPLLGGPGVIEIRARGDSPQRASASTPVPGAIGGLTAEFAKVAGELDASAPDSLLARLKSQLDETRADSLVTGLRRTIFDLAVAMHNIRTQTDAHEQDALMAKLAVTMDHLTVIADNLRRQTEVNAEGSMAARLSQSIDELNRALAQTTGILVENREDIRAAVGHVRQSSETLAMRVLEPIAGELDRDDGLGVLGKVHVLLDHVDRVMTDAEVVGRDVRETVALNTPALGRTIDNLKVMSDHLMATSKDLKRNPWRLLYRPSLEDTAELNLFDASREFAEASGRINDALARLEGLARAEGANLKPDDPVLQGIREELTRTHDELAAMRSALWERLRKP